MLNKNKYEVLKVMVNVLIHFRLFILCLLIFHLITYGEAMLQLFSKFQDVQLLIISLMMSVIILLSILYFKINGNKNNNITNRKSKNRLCMLVIVVALQCLTITIIWNLLAPFCKENSWLKGLYAPLFIAVPGYMIWYWRDKHKETDLANTKKDLDIKEMSTDWENYFKWIEIASDESKSDIVRADSIDALSIYFDKGEMYSKKVFNFYKNFLDDFWNKIMLSDWSIKIYRQCVNDSHELPSLYKEEIIDNIESTINKCEGSQDLALGCDKYSLLKREFEEKLSVNENLFIKMLNISLDLNMISPNMNFNEIYKHIPLYIKAIHEVIINQLLKDKKIILCGPLNLSFSRIDMKSFSECDLRNLNFSYSTFASTNFTNCQFFGVNFDNSYFGEVNFMGNTFSNCENLKNLKLMTCFFNDNTFDASYFSNCSFKHYSLGQYKKINNLEENELFQNCSFEFEESGD